jgi:hypothetical protein
MKKRPQAGKSNQDKGDTEAGNHDLLYVIKFHCQSPPGIPRTQPVAVLNSLHLNAVEER